MKHTYLRLFSVAAIMLLPFCTNAQGCSPATNIATFAGNHTEGTTGDGGAATAAQIGRPAGVATDAAGNVYIADYDHNIVRKVDAAGVISTFAGTGIAGYNGDNISASTAQLNGPAGVTVDATGNVYIADKFNERIRKVNGSGIITTIAGNGLHGGWLGADPGNEGPALAAALTYPVSLAFDCSGNIYIADVGSQTVRKIDGAGIIHLFAGTAAGGYNGDGIPATSAQLYEPTNVVADCSGNVYIADAWNNRVRKVNASGIISTYAGNGDSTYAGDGGPATAASIWIPAGLTLDGCGNLYICDYNNNVVRKVDGSGNISTFAGTNTRGYNGDGAAAVAAQIYLPSQLAIDATGNIYIADFGNYVVRFMGTLPYASRAFVSGTTQNLSTTENASAVSINSLMAIHDDAAGKTETWTVSRIPTHGTLSGFSASVVSAGGTVTPSGLTYTPTPGYSGPDDFTVQMADGTTTASTTVNVNVNPLPTAVSTTVAQQNTPVIFPNPGNGSFTYKFVSPVLCDLELSVSDVTGRVVYSQPVHAVAGENSIAVQLPAAIQHSSIMFVALGNKNTTYPNTKIVITE